MNYYDKKGEKISLEKACELRSDDSYRIIGQNEIGKYFISTIWLGFNHGFRPDEKLLFETMVFDQSLNNENNQWTALELERYSTEKEAIEGHAAMKKKYEEIYASETSKA